MLFILAGQRKQERGRWFASARKVLLATSSPPRAMEKAGSESSVGWKLTLRLHHAVNFGYEGKRVSTDPLFFRFVLQQVQSACATRSSIVREFCEDSPFIIFSTYFAIRSASRLTGSPGLSECRFVISTV